MELALIRAIVAIIMATISSTTVGPCVHTRALGTVWVNWIFWGGCTALLAFAPVVGPSMRVLSEGDEICRWLPTIRGIFVGSLAVLSSLVTFFSAARFNRDRLETAASTFWAAISDATNLGGQIELFIVNAVERTIADFTDLFLRVALRALLEGRDLEVNVKMLRAAHLLVTVTTQSSVVCVDKWTIRIMLVWAHISKEVLVILVVRGVWCNLVILGLGVTFFTLWMAMALLEEHTTLVIASGPRPFASIVHIWADGGAAFVCCLPCLIDASFCATVGNQIVLSEICHEDIKVAFNLLRGRPINLAVLLLTLQIWHRLLVDLPTLVLARVIVIGANGFSPEVLLTHALLELALDTITFHICVQEDLVCRRAFFPRFFPLGVLGLVLCDGSLQPSSIPSLAV
jgi:hypothetical protein